MLSNLEVDMLLGYEECDAFLLLKDLFIESGSESIANMVLRLEEGRV